MHSTNVHHQHARSTRSARGTGRPADWAARAAFVLGPPLLGFLVGLLTPRGEWYDSLDKAPGNPPGEVFGPVWTVLYVLMGIAAAIVWSDHARTELARRHRRVALVAWGVQLAINLAWSLVFFGAERAGWALVDIVALIVALAVTIALFARVDRRAAALLLPYLAWVLFATYLNAYIVIAN